MVLIDALYINTGGGKVLLDYLIKELEKTELKVFYLLDKRIAKNHPPIKSKNQVLPMKASLYGRYSFYKENKNIFSGVLCFGNLPPLKKIKPKTFTYFHQPLFLNIPNTIDWKARFLIKTKTSILNLVKNNTDCFLVQSAFIKNGLVQKYSLDAKKVLAMPFYPPLPKNKNLKRKKHTFLYVSSGTAHKNQGRLIKAFCDFFDQHKRGALILTVGNQHKEVIQQIDRAKEEGYPISNLGFVDRETLAKTYQESEYLIFPSLAESFGLGLIEAIEQGCKVIAADLPYTYEVCEPSLTFDPLSVKSITIALEITTNKELKPSKPLIRNNINQLINLLSD